MQPNRRASPRRLAGAHQQAAGFRSPVGALRSSLGRWSSVPFFVALVEEEASAKEDKPVEQNDRKNRAHWGRLVVGQVTLALQRVAARAARPRSAPADNYDRRSGASRQPISRVQQAAWEGACRGPRGQFAHVAKEKAGRARHGPAPAGGSAPRCELGREPTGRHSLEHSVRSVPFSRHVTVRLSESHGPAQGPVRPALAMPLRRRPKTTTGPSSPCGMSGRFGAIQSRPHPPIAASTSSVPRGWAIRWRARNPRDSREL